MRDLAESTRTARTCHFPPYTWGATLPLRGVTVSCICVISQRTASSDKQVCAVNLPRLRFSLSAYQLGLLADSYPPPLLSLRRQSDLHDWTGPLQLTISRVIHLPSIHLARIPFVCLPSGKSITNLSLKLRTLDLFSTWIWTRCASVRHTYNKQVRLSPRSRHSVAAKRCLMTSG